MEVVSGLSHRAFSLTGRAIGTARATPPPKQFTPCAGSGPHRREGKLPPRTSSAKVTAGINPECRESRPAGGKDQPPKGYRERQTGRCGMFRSPTGRTTVQSATNPMLHAETPCNSTRPRRVVLGALGALRQLQARLRDPVLAGDAFRQGAAREGPDPRPATGQAADPTSRDALHGGLPAVPDQRNAGDANCPPGCAEPLQGDPQRVCDTGEQGGPFSLTDGKAPLAERLQAPDQRQTP